jgi:hypothetical protein
MTTLFTFLFVATMATSPVSTLENVKNSNISYVCFIENGNMMLTKVEKEDSHFTTETTDTGISTNNIEKVTMSLQNSDLCMTVSYQDSEPLNAYFNSNSLEMNQISITDVSFFAVADPIAE